MQTSDYTYTPTYTIHEHTHTHTVTLSHCIILLGKKKFKPTVVALTYSLSILEAEAGSLRPVWAIKEVPGQLGIYSKTLSRKLPKRKK